MPSAVAKSFRSSQVRSRRGSVLIYCLVLMTILLAMISLAVDYGHAQLVKTQLQRDADATARGTLQLYVNGGSSVAAAYAPILGSGLFNPVDANSGVQPTVTVTWGYWNASTHTFTAGSGTPLAVQVTASRTAATGNAVPLTFPLFNGSGAIRTTCDVSATAIAVLSTGSSVNNTVPGTADIWLSDMPAGSNAGWSDNPSVAAPTLAMTVTPGTTLTFTATGLTCNKGPVGIWGPDGSGSNTTHMQGSPDGNYNGVQNGIQSLTAPQNSLIGVFLTDAAPNTVATPATALSYTSTTENQSAYNSLQVQQPFFIGDGQTSGGNTQTFVVPAGATKLYLGVFDGWQNWDNPGSLSVTTTQQPQIFLVK